MRDTRRQWLFQRAVATWRLDRFEFVPHTKLRYCWRLYDQSGKLAGELKEAGEGFALVVDPHWMES